MSACRRSERRIIHWDQTISGGSIPSSLPRKVDFSIKYRQPSLGRHFHCLWCVFLFVSQARLHGSREGMAVCTVGVWWRVSNIQCRHLIPAPNARAARAKNKTAHPIATEFAGYRCMGDNLQLNVALIRKLRGH